MDKTRKDVPTVLKGRGEHRDLRTFVRGDLRRRGFAKHLTPRQAVLLWEASAAGEVPGDDQSLLEYKEQVSARRRRKSLFIKLKGSDLTL